MALARLGKELQMLATDPPPGVAAWPVDDSTNHLRAHIKGPEDTPYANGIFLVDVHVPDRYPFEPPKVRFMTPIYHPNVDSGGRICLDTLKMKPTGSWTPSINIPTLLTTIRTLMAHPNGDDGLMPEITKLFVGHRSQFEEIAREHTARHATAEAASSLAGAQAPISEPVEGDRPEQDVETASNVEKKEGESPKDTTKENAIEKNEEKHSIDSAKDDGVAGPSEDRGRISADEGYSDGSGSDGDDNDDSGESDREGGKPKRQKT